MPHYPLQFGLITDLHYTGGGVVVGWWYGRLAKWVIWAFIFNMISLWKNFKTHNINQTFWATTHGTIETDCNKHNTQAPYALKWMIHFCPWIYMELWYLALIYGKSIQYRCPSAHLWKRRLDGFMTCNRSVLQPGYSGITVSIQRLLMPCMAPCVARSSATMALTMQVKLSLIFNEGGLILPVQIHCREMIEVAEMIKCCTVTGYCGLLIYYQGIVLLHLFIYISQIAPEVNRRVFNWK